MDFEREGRWKGTVPRMPGNKYLIIREPVLNSVFSSWLPLGLNKACPYGRICEEISYLAIKWNSTLISPRKYIPEQVCSHPFLLSPNQKCSLKFAEIHFLDFI